jgi:phosphoribosylformylglycinamidine cyclo-ligase
VTADRTAYRAAGVDVDAGDRAVALMRAAVESTRRPEVLGGLGGFAAAVGVPAGYRDPVLVSSTDGVGTKTAIAGTLRRFDTIGRDLVAMCADDVVCSGASPLFFLDYLAVGRVDPEDVAELVEGIASGCRDAGCALVGGETAEHPGLIEPGGFDLAGVCVGIVERGELIDGSAVQPGDVVIGLASNGLHANGYSLVRTLIERWQLDLARPYQEQLRLTLGDRDADTAIAAEPAYALATIGEVLLTPTEIYVGRLLAARARLRKEGADVRGIAHVTGGGLPGNAPRMIPAELGVRIDPGMWRVPSVIRLFAALGGLDDEEMRATFNGGLGMTLAVSREAAPAAVEALLAEGLSASIVGEIAPLGDLDGRRYVERSSRGTTEER